LKPLKEPVKGTSGSGLSVGAKNRVKTPTLPPIAPAPAAADAVSLHDSVFLKKKILICTVR
jgi:hypothetical protein